MSQYVPEIVAVPELIAAKILQIIPIFKSWPVLIAIATIVEKYFSPLNTCSTSFSSTKRRRHCKHSTTLSLMSLYNIEEDICSLLCKTLARLPEEYESSME